MRALNKSDCLKNHFSRLASIPTAAAIKSGHTSCCNTNERDNNKFNVNEGRSTKNAYQYARSYTATAAATDCWPAHQRSSRQHSVLSKYFEHQRLFVRHLCTVKVTRKKMVSDQTFISPFFSLGFCGGVDHTNRFHCHFWLSIIAKTNSVQITIENAEWKKCGKHRY